MTENGRLKEELSHTHDNLVLPEFDGKESEPHVTTERETGVAWGFSEGREAKTG